MELHRVLCDHGCVLLRGAFPDADALVDLAVMLEFFPAAERVLATFPKLVDTVVRFERAGFRLVGMRAVPDLAAASLADALGRCGSEPTRSFVSFPTPNSRPECAVWRPPSPPRIPRTRPARSSAVSRSWCSASRAPQGPCRGHTEPAL
jgi:hypothetical protein